MSHVFQLRGAPALSAFRIAKLVAALKRIAPEVEAVAAEFWHFVEVAKAPDPLCIWKAYRFWGL